MEKDKNFLANTTNTPGEQWLSLTDEVPLPPIPSPPQLPSLYLQNILFDQYIQHVYPLFPIVQKDDIIEKVEVNTGSSLISKSPPHNSAIQEYNRPSKQSLLLILAVFMVSAEFLRNESLLDTPYKNCKDLAATLFLEAQKLTMLYMDSPRISTICAFILMAHYLERTHSNMKRKHPMVRVFAGISFSMAQDLLLHKNLCLPSDVLHQRSKLFWSLFAFDRLIAVTHDRPLVFSEQDCTVPYPKDDNESNPHTIYDIRAFVEYVKLMACIGRILTFHSHSSYTISMPQLEWHRDTMLSLDSSLASWYMNIPASLHYSTQSLEQSPTTSFIYNLNIWFYTALILLHRPYIGQEVSKNVIPLKICKHAADQIRLIADDMEGSEDDAIDHPEPPYFCVALAENIYTMGMSVSSNI